MEILKDKFKREPAVMIAAIVVILEAFIITVLPLFVTMTPEQIASLATFTGVIGTAGSGIFTRQNVYSPATFEGMKASQEAHLEKSAQ